MPAMSQQDTEAYLSAPHVAQFATVRPDERPHLAPVWFKWEGERAYVMCGGNAVKVRNIVRNPAVTLSVANDERPYKYVALEGTAEVLREDSADTVRRICVHYEGPERGQNYAQRLLSSSWDLAVIEIAVKRIVGWVEPERP